MSGTPLFPDHAPLFLNSRIGQREKTRPIMQDQQARINDSRRSHRGIGHHIDGLVERGIGIEVLAITHPDTFDVFVHAVVGEMYASIESHVLQEMRQSPLVLFFEDRAHILSNIKIRSLLGQRIVANIIGQSITQLSITYLRVDRKLLRLLGEKGKHADPCPQPCQK